MKRIFLFLISLIPFLLPAQSWEPIKPGNVYHYQRMQDSLVVSLWVDSSSVAGPDSVRYLNRRIVPLMDERGVPSLALINQPHFLMKQYQLAGDSLYRCIDSTEILFYSHLSEGDTRAFSPARNLDATLLQKTDSLIFGQPDSVQQFLLSDGQVLWWSKTWGILQFPLLAPDSSGWQLIGVEGIDNGGERMPTFKDFIVWKAGDVLEFMHGVRSITTETRYRDKLTLLSRVGEEPTATDLRFRVARIRRISERFGFSVSTSSLQDTLIISLIDSTPHPTNLHSFEWVPHRNNGSLLQDFPYVGFVRVFRGGDDIWTKVMGGISYASTLYTQNSDTLFTDMIGYPLGVQIYTTGKGLSRSELSWGLAERLEDSILIAYRTATDTFGTLSEDSMLLSIPVSELPSSFEAYPNPVSDYLMLKWEIEDLGEKIDIQVVDAQGKIVRKASLPHSLPLLPFHDLAKGVYILQIQGKQGGIRVKKK